MKILDVPQSGSVGGVTSSRNRYGQYRRTRATPVNPSTPAQNTVRAMFTYLSQAWSTVLDTVNRDAWNAFALNYPQVDSLGQTYYLTGHQMFIRLNLELQLLGQSLLMYPVPPAVGDLAEVTEITSTNGGADLNIIWTDAVSLTNQIIIEASPCVSPGVEFNGRYRKIAAIGSGASPVNVASNYSAVFGPPISARVIFLRTWTVDNGFQTHLRTWRVVVAD